MQMQTDIAIQQIIACMIKDRQYKEAEATIEKYIRANPDKETYLRYYLGLIYIHQERAEEAVEEIKKVLDKKPDDTNTKELAVKLFIYQGECKAQEEDWEGVSADLSAALEISPDDQTIKEKFLHLKNILPVSYLNSGKRKDAAEFWENEQKKNLADHSITHHLFLLYYWWAMDTEKKYCLNDNNNTKIEIKFLDSLWEKTIANWAMLINIDEFWGKWKHERETACSIQISDENIQELHTKLSSQIKKEFHDYADHYKENQNEAESTRHERYQVNLILELESASYCKELLEHSSHNIQSIPVCGPLMIKQLDRMSDLEQLLNKESNKDPGNEKIEKMKLLFSEFGKIFILIDQKKPKQALSEIKELPRELRSSTGGRRLQAMAYLECGKQIMENNGDLDSALDYWEKGMDFASDHNTIEQQLTEIISNTFKDQATRLGNTDNHDEAITTLEKGIKIITDPSLKKPLKDLLAFHYCERSINRINDDDNHFGGKRDVKTALENNPEYTKAKNTLATIYNNEGMQYFDDGKLDDAIASAEKALKYNPHNHNFKEILAIRYNGKGIEYVDLGNMDKAIYYFRKANELDPSDETISENLRRATRY